MLAAELVGQGDELPGRAPEEFGYRLLAPVPLHREGGHDDALMSAQAHDAVAVFVQQPLELVFEARQSLLSLQGVPC